MKVREVKIKNFRSIHDLTVNFSNFAVLIGRNNSGKTSILDAIRVVFENLDHECVKTINLDALSESQRNQAMGLWFFTNYKEPTEIHALVELDENEIDGELKDLCELKEEIKGVEVKIRIRYLTNERKLVWELNGLDVIGYVSKTPKKALEVLNAYGGKPSDAFTHCQVVNESQIVNARAFDKVVRVLKDKVHTIIPFKVTPDPRMADVKIRAILRESLVPKELSENLKIVLEDPELREYFYEYCKEAKGLEYDYVDEKSKMYERVRLSLELFGGGEQMLDCLIATLLSKGEGHIFLIEEPELHMHPAYVRGLAQIFEKITKDRNLQIIAITQSPEFVTAVRDKSSVIGVRKKYTRVFASSKPVTEIYRPYSKGEEYLIGTLAHELGVSPGYFYFIEAAILVEGRSDKILLQHYIRSLMRERRIHYLPRTSYNIFEYRQDRLESLLRVLHGLFKTKVFVLADNDDQGRSQARKAQRAGLQINKEVFVLSEKDILCYIPPEIIGKVLEDVISTDLKIDLDKLKDAKTKLDEKEISALEILNEIKRVGIIKDNTDLLKLLVHGLSDAIPDDVKKVRGWKKDIYYSLKPIIAEKAIEYIKEVPDEIARILIIIDRGVGDIV